MADGPLSGVLVVEVCGWLTGPMTTAILADQGADVIKVEAPGGDEYRRGGTSRGGLSTTFMAANRNKRSVTLDLKKQSHCAVLRKIVAKADVFIQNLRPGAVERLGFGAEELHKEFPLLIHTSISGYGKTGPKAAERGFDPMIQALSGMAAFQADATGRPQMVRTLVPDKVTAPIVAQAICAALFKRERTGRGSTIEYAMLDGVVWWMWPDAMRNDTFLGEGVTPGIGSSATTDSICKTADGYMAVSPHQDTAWRSFAKVVNKPEWIDDPRFSSFGTRMRNMKDYRDAIASVMCERTNAEWSALLSAADVPCAPVLSVSDVVDNDQLKWNGLVEEVEHPTAGRYRAPKSPVSFDGVRNGVWRRVPQAGENTAEVLREFEVELEP